MFVAQELSIYFSWYKICTNFYSQSEGDRLLSLDDGRGLFEDGKGLFDDGNLFLVEGLEFAKEFLE